MSNWKFAPRLWPTLVTAVLLPTLVALGAWQLHRAQYKRDLHGAFLSRQTAEPLDLNSSAQRHDRDEMLWRQISASGSFDDATNILLDNQVLASVAGYFVYVPFQLDRTGEWVLVNRGWVPVGEDRRLPPALTGTRAPTTILAVAKTTPATGIRLENTPPERLGPAMFRVQHVDLEQAAALVDRPLLPYVLRLTPESQEGYVRKWLMPGSGEARHLGYAFQWFALAATLAIIYVWLNLSRQTNEERAGE